MAATLTELEWRREAARMAVLVADAPPHGIGEGVTNSSRVTPMVSYLFGKV